jgi:hypothetical protein
MERRYTDCPVSKALRNKIIPIEGAFFVRITVAGLPLDILAHSATFTENRIREEFACLD